MKSRLAPFSDQLGYLIRRNFLYNVRNPRGTLGLIFIGICNGGLYAMIFHGLGKQRIWNNPLEHPADDIVAHNRSTY